MSKFKSKTTIILICIVCICLFIVLYKQISALTQEEEETWSIKATTEELSKARYKTVIKDENGSDYQLYMIPKSEEESMGFYRGDYGFVLQKVGSDSAFWQVEEVLGFSFNDDFGLGNVEMVSVFKGEPKAKFDLLVLSEKESVNDNLLRLYTIHDGKLLQLKIEGISAGYSIVAANIPKLISSNMIQNVTYSNRDEDFGWVYENYHIDFKTGLLIKDGQSTLYNDENFDEGKEVYEHWMNEPDYFVQIEQESGVKWDEEWTRLGAHESGVLEISNANSSNFDFNLTVTSGAHADLKEGYAKIRGNKATYRDTDTACMLTFTHNGESIQIEETEDCAWEIPFAGNYELHPVQIEASLYPDVIDTEAVNEEFQQLTDDDYELFYNSMQIVYKDLYDNEVNGKVITGAVKGLYTFMEAIIIIGDDGYLYGAVINDGSIHYYTNNPDYKERLPESIITWMEGFNEYEVKYMD